LLRKTLNLSEADDESASFIFTPADMRDWKNAATVSHVIGRASCVAGAM
jgi:hypothetical protein